MKKLHRVVKRIWTAQQGQDLIEYALMAASVAVVAGAIFPPSVMPAVSVIFEKIVTIFQQAP